jgi:hypothetical protein
MNTAEKALDKLDPKLVGTLIGTPGSYANKGNTINKAVDGNPNDFFDSNSANGAWVGYDLGAEFSPTGVIFGPRNSWSGWANRLVGGKFQGSNSADFSNSIDLYTIPSPPPKAVTTVTLPGGSFRFIRYLSPNGGYGNISSLAFYGVPTASPVNQIASVAGGNLIGTVEPISNPAVHPQLGTAASYFNFKFVRLWTEGSMLKPMIPQWASSLAWNALGISVIAVLNFQNMGLQGDPLRNTAPSDAIWTAYLNSVPPKAETGVTYFEIGNELDYNAYYVGTPEQYVRLLQIAAPILHAKGYKIIMANCLFGLGIYETLKGLGAFQYVDAAGCHCYYGSASPAINGYKAGLAFMQEVGVEYICTEVSLERVATGQFPTEIVKLYKALWAMGGGAFIYFPFINIDSDTTDIGGLLDTDKGYEPRQPYYDALASAILPAAA